MEPEKMSFGYGRLCGSAAGEKSDFVDAIRREQPTAVFAKKLLGHISDDEIYTFEFLDGKRRYHTCSLAIDPWASPAINGDMMQRFKEEFGMPLVGGYIDRPKETLYRFFDTGEHGWWHEIRQGEHAGGQSILPATTYQAWKDEVSRLSGEIDVKYAIGKKQEHGVFDIGTSTDRVVLKFQSRDVDLENILDFVLDDLAGKYHSREDLSDSVRWTKRVEFYDR
ncbi:hypothetical protein HYV86_03980 [Candidatus Woesearchaeota archaeon]|nr:hypothetical protein [Candidatus Woesearchaeota archaeon]